MKGTLAVAGTPARPRAVLCCAVPAVPSSSFEAMTKLGLVPGTITQCPQNSVVSVNSKTSLFLSAVLMSAQTAFGLYCIASELRRRVEVCCMKVVVENESLIAREAFRCCNFGMSALFD